MASSSGSESESTSALAQESEAEQDASESELKASRPTAFEPDASEAVKFELKAFKPDAFKPDASEADASEADAPLLKGCVASGAMASFGVSGLPDSDWVRSSSDGTAGNLFDSSSSSSSSSSVSMPFMVILSPVVGDPFPFVGGNRHRGELGNVCVRLRGNFFLVVITIDAIIDGLFPFVGDPFPVVGDLFPCPSRVMARLFFTAHNARCHLRPPTAHFETQSTRNKTIPTKSTARKHNSLCSQTHPATPSGNGTSSPVQTHRHTHSLTVTKFIRQDK